MAAATTLLTGGAAGAQTFSVTSGFDSGDGTLRAAIIQANAFNGPATINFTGPLTVSLGSDLFPLTNPFGITINGNGATIDGLSSSNTSGVRGFFIGVSPDIANPSLPATPSAVYNINSLALRNLNARGGHGGRGLLGGGGGAGMGGALFVNAGVVNLSNVVFQDNRAVGGNGGTFSAGSAGNGGGGGMGGNGGHGTFATQQTTVLAAGGGGGGLGAGFNLLVGSGADGGSNSAPGNHGTFFFPAVAAPAGSGGGGGTAGAGAGGTNGGGGGSGVLFAGVAGGGGGGVGGTNGEAAALFNPLSRGGFGGFGGGGGGGGGASLVDDNPGGTGGFGGGGGGDGFGGFGGGGGGNFSGAFGAAVQGGFGGGSGADRFVDLGNPTLGNGGGGGGAGLGGAVFVRQGATVNFVDGGISGNAVAGGWGAAGGVQAQPNPNGTDGQAIGQGIFLAGAATYTVTDGKTIGIADSIGGGVDAQITGGFTKAGNGTLVLASPSNNYTGMTTVAGGVLRLDAAGAIGGGPVVVGSALSPARLVVNANQTVASLETSFGAETEISNFAVLSVNEGGSSTYNGPITGEGTLRKVGATALTLSGAQDNLIFLEVSGGNVNLGKTGGPGINAAKAISGLPTGTSVRLTGTIFDDQIADTGGITMSGGVLDLNGRQETINFLQGTGLVTSNGLFPGTLRFNGSFLGGLTELNFQDGTSPVRLIKQGGSAVRLSGSLDHSYTEVAGGTLELVGQTVRDVTVRNGARLVLVPGSVGAVSFIGTTTVEAGGAIDVTSGGAVFGAGTDATVRAWLMQGYNNGDWAGTGLTSSAAAASPEADGVGYGLASEVLGIGPGQTADFLGKTVGPDDVLAAYTLSGDTNLDRIVNIGDFSALAANFNSPGGWVLGDFTYNGTTGIEDFALLAANFNQVLPRTYPAETVPEPGAAAVAAGLLALRLGRRGRRLAIPAAGPAGTP